MTEPAAIAVTWRPLADLKPYERNARVHPEEQIKSLMASLLEFGWTKPVFIAEDVLIAGHGITTAAQRVWDAGLEIPRAPRDVVPTIDLSYLSPAQRRAYVLADNELGARSRWDNHILGLELEGLKSIDFKLEPIGFTLEDRTSIFAGSDTAAGAENEDDTPEAPPVPKTQPGEIWQLGDHRLLCGDATNAAMMQQLFGGEQIHMLLTDPPYCSGGFQEAGKAAGSVGTRGTEMVANDTLSTRGYMALMKSVIPNVGAGVVYVFTDWRMWINLFDVVESSGFGVRNMVVWDKGTPGMGAGWRMQHELVMCAIKVKSPFNPKKAQGNVIRCKRTGNILHATQKPVELLRQIIEVTDKAVTVCDPFLGSGSTLIACEETKRRCFAVELTPRYCDVTIARWEKFTGKTAERVKQ